MPNPKLETYKNKATGTVYDYTDAAAQAALAGILDGTDIDSFSDVESALADKVDVVSGKGLSTNDYDDTEKAKVAGAFPRSEQAVLGAKNLLPFDLNKIKSWNTAGTWNGNVYTLFGVDFTVNENDGTVTANGTANANNCEFRYAFNIDIPNGQYYVCGGISSTIRVYYFDGSTYYDATTAPTLCNVVAQTGTRFALVIANGQAVNNVVFKPMLVLPTEIDFSYVPHAMTNKELTEKFGDKVDFNAIFLPAKYASVYTGDLNDLPCGVRYIGANAANSPHDWSIVITFSTSGSDMPTAAYGAQIAIGSGYSGMYYRRKDNGTWQNWQSITLS